MVEDCSLAREVRLPTRVHAARQIDGGIADGPGSDDGQWSSRGIYPLVSSSLGPSLEGTGVFD